MTDGMGTDILWTRSSEFAGSCLMFMNLKKCRAVWKHTFEIRDKESESRNEKDKIHVSSVFLYSSVCSSETIKQRVTVRHV